jgi:hypothetical protein
LVAGRSLPAACEIAVGFTVDSILRSKEAEADNRFGVDFEAGLAGLSALLTSY